MASAAPGIPPEAPDNTSTPAVRPVPGARSRRDEARRQLFYELISGGSGVILAFFMWGHMFLVGSILTGARGFDALAGGLEAFYIAQPTVIAITALFLIHGAMASRKIPAQIRDRRRLRRVTRELKRRQGSVPPHVESALWPWQAWTGMVLLVLGSFHLVLVGLDVFTDLYGERTGIEAVSTQARVGGGLWMVYAVLLLCVEFHASTGLYRFAVKWGVGARLGRPLLRRVEHVLLFGFLGLGALTLVVLAGWIDPPLAFLLGA
jgi:fumarate reductase subunit C